jgi:hypothetical protein
MAHLQLEGSISDPNLELEELRDENDHLRDELRQAKVELAQARHNSIQSLAALTALRQVLNPLKRAILSIYGELDLVPEQPATSSSSTSSSSTNSNPKWESWKLKMPGQPAQIIDHLLLHEEASVTQLATALRARENTIRTVLSRMSGAGLVHKEGGKFGKYKLREI